MGSHMAARMCRSLGNSVIALWLSMAGLPFAQTLPLATIPSTQVDHGVFVAAGAPGVGAFASALASASIPAGFVVSSEESVRPGTAGASQDASQVSVRMAVDHFLRKHTDYAIARSDWALVVRPRAQTVCDAVLGRLLPDATISDPAYVALWRLARTVNPDGTPAAAPSVVCGSGCDAAEQHHDSHVTLTLSRSSLQEALSQVVSQAPGLVWVLRDERRAGQTGGAAVRICRLSYFDGNRSIATSYVFASVSEGRR